MVSNADLVTITDSAMVDDAVLAGHSSLDEKNYATSGYMTVGWANNEALDNRPVMRFDVSAIPAGATINSATLEFSFRDAGYGTAMVEVCKITPANAGWIEGVGQDVDALPGEVCWNYKNFNTAAWAGSAGLNTPGVDYDATPLATVPNYRGAGATNPTNGYDEWMVDITSTVQDWVNTPANNAGLLFKNQDGYGLVQSNMVSSEFVAGEYYYEPALVVDYTPVPEPMTIAILGLGGLLIRRKK